MWVKSTGIKPQWNATRRKQRAYFLECIVCSSFASWFFTLNTLRPRQNGSRFADDTFKLIFLNENVRISIKISPKFVPKGPINNNPALVQIMAWCRSGDKPLSEPMMVSLLTHICVTRPQWVRSVTIHVLVAEAGSISQIPQCNRQYQTMNHFVTEMCTQTVHCVCVCVCVWGGGGGGGGNCALWDGLCDRSNEVTLEMTSSTRRPLWMPSHGNVTLVPCTQFQNNLTIEMGIGCERDVTIFEFYWKGLCFFCSLQLHLRLFPYPCPTLFLNCGSARSRYILSIFLNHVVRSAKNAC